MTDDTTPAPAFQDVVFTLPFALASLNVRQRTHFGELTRQRNTLIQEVMAAIGGPRYYPRPPFPRARITIVRASAGKLDPDNLTASVKPVLDVLCVASPRHPGSLGIIEDDSARHIELIVRQSDAPKGAGTTLVRVEWLPPPPAPPPMKKPKPRMRRNYSRKPTPDQLARVHAARFGKR